MQEHQGHDRLAARRIARKPHTKSRYGCENCKKRRIKCDERKPQCSNCIRHASECSFALLFSQPIREPSSQSMPFMPAGTASFTPRPSISYEAPPVVPSGPSGPALADPQMMNILDLELMHHYNTSTSLTTTNNPELQTFMRINAPQLGFSHPLVLHGILSVSALHMSHFKKGDSHARYLHQARYHNQSALRAATALLPEIDGGETCSALWLYTTFCLLFTLGMGPRSGDFLLFGNEGLSEWFVLFRSLQSFLKQNQQFLLEKSDLSPLFSISNRMINKDPSDNEHLRGLREQILATSSHDPDLPMYLSALEDLSMSFPPSTMGSPGSRAAQVSPQYVFAWMHRLTEDFVLALRQRKPIALAIFAHFCVLLNDLTAFWWVKGWAEHLISEIHASLSKEYRMWLRWPIEEIGWIPG